MNVRFWKATISAAIIALIIEYVVHDILLMPEYQVLQLTGAMRASNFGQMLFTPLLILLAVYVMCEFLEKLDRAHNIHSIKHGVQFGVLFTIPTILTYLYYNIPITIPIIAAAGDILAFGLAAKIYHKLNAHPGNVPKEVKAKARKRKR